MAGKIIADTIEASGSQISLNVGNVTILTASSTGLTLIPTTNVNVNLTNSIVTLTPGSATAPGLTFSGNTRTGLFMPAANTVAFTAANTEVMRIDSSGNVGIGTNSPILGLTIKNDTGSTTYGQRLGSLVLESNNVLGGGGTDIVWSSGTQTNQRYASIGSSIIGNDGVSGSRGNIVFATKTNSADTTLTERMRIDSSGNIGIGTSSPGYKVEMAITSGSNFYSATTSVVGQDIGYRLASTATSGREYRISTSDPTRGTYGAGLAFLDVTAGASRMLIDSSGNFFVNQTSLTGAEKVGISFDRGGSWGLAIKNTSATSPSNATYVSFYYTSTNTGSINSTGTTTSYGTSSDYRLKENIAPMTGALNKVSQLKPCTYVWKSTGEESQGFIAHELQEVVPECVTGEKDAVNEDGSIKPQGIDTSFLVATLTAAIQELKAIVDAQAVEIAALKAK